MRKILFLPLLGTIFALLLYYYYPFLYPISFIIIAVSIFSFIWLIRKTHAKIVQLKPFTILGNQPTVLECPKCGGKLRSNPGQLPPLYACTKCGYHGAVALNPKEGK